MSRLYAIGDVHGQREMLRQAHARVEADRRACGDESAPLVHLGDLTDRGPDAAGVIADIIEGIEAGLPWQVIRGNHDQLFLDFLDFDGVEDPRIEAARWWLQPNLGGSETLRSYGIEPVGGDILSVQRAVLSTVPPRHLQFLQKLPYTYETEHLICVHAGIRPGVPMAQQDPEDLIWIRFEFLDDTRDHGKLIVHGHTPVERPEHHGNRVNLDTGAGYGRPVTAAVFEGRDVWVLTDTGRVRL